MTNINTTNINNNEMLIALYEALLHNNSPKAAIATILMKSGYCCRSYVGQMRWKCAMRAASDVIDYVYATRAYKERETYLVRDEQGEIGYIDAFALFSNGDYYDFRRNKAVYKPQGAIACLLNAEKLWRDAMHTAYCVNQDRLTRNQVYDWEHLYAMLYDCRRPLTVSGRHKMQKAVALWTEEIRHRNTKWAIKYE